MKHFVQYTDTTEGGDGTTVRLLEISGVPQQSSKASSIMECAAIEACKQTILKMSRLNGDRMFAWGHEEEDGRTWLHGFAINGTYRDEEGKEVNTRRVDIMYEDGRSETLRASSNPFEFDLFDERWSGVSSMMFLANGMEAASIHLKKGEQ